jgi:hypothetical protein
MMRAARSPLILSVFVENEILEVARSDCSFVVVRRRA